MLALAPKRVRREEATAGNIAPIAALLPQLRARGIQAVSPNGVLGDPAGASAGEGHTLLRAAMEELVAMVDAWERRA
jgi:creatinine amidohydrolase/Fe(II)-dependent formamide hydrolase-like protein